MTATVDIDSIDLEANGVARLDGKVVFVRGALPGERVEIDVLRRKPRYDVAQVRHVLRANSARVQPRCPHFGVCGGCSMQHLDPRAQLAIKQRALEDTLWHLGRTRAERILRPLAGPSWGYRHRARLSVRHVPKKGGVLVGFHERGRSYVADMRECHVLPRQVSALLLPLRALVEALSIRERLPQIEVALGDDVLALVLRILEPLTPVDRERLLAFAAGHGIELWLQPGGPETVRLFCTAQGLEVVPPGADDALPAASRLAYRLDEFDVELPFRPTDFTQVNHAINAALVSRAVRLLEPKPSHRLVDFFCGLGNFTLPLARRADMVIGIEGSPALVRRARDNAARARLDQRTRFDTADLFEFDAAAWQRLGRVDRVLIDPPREGALAIAKALSDAGAERPSRIVYVSCNPATLARDAAILVHQGGYALRAAGVVNMFPHTSHVESVAVFEPDGPLR
ncbi:MAG: 23S rRNA (uracil(1939)-C(5))-methyltransferase RlmD [Burkholderiales bacterium]|nr:MAG: 23S rRNA (uracil(1939)-C(5))-methyltransferase RlmD [Burkholderiales bacterium]